jgi:NADH-quinone oxidoreductase subunit H
VPRLRYDQVMHFGWKALIPLNLGWILSVATARVLHDRGRTVWASAVIAGAGMLLVLLIAWSVYDSARVQRLQDRLDEDEVEAAQQQTFPTPPMDLVVPSPRSLASASARRTPASLEKGGDGG